MNILFLDFDGVLLTLRTGLSDRSTWSQATCDPVLVKAIDWCCQAGVKIVVSSSWRDMEDICKQKLVDCDLLKYLHEDWRTKTIDKDQPLESRPFEISEWLSRHVETETYRILDDDLWMWTDSHKDKVLQCHPEDGASGQVIHALMKWANVDGRIPRKDSVF